MCLTIALLTIGGFAQEKATLYILRPYDFAAAMGAVYGGKKYYSFHHYITIDGNLFGNIPTLTYYRVEVDPGTYNIIGYVGNTSFDELKRQGQSYSCAISVYSGQSCYLRIDEKKYKIDLIDNQKFQKELKKNYPVQYAATYSYTSGTFYAQGEDRGQQLSNGALYGSVTSNSPQQTQPTAPVSQPQASTTTSSEQQTSTKQRVLSDVDKNIPTTHKTEENTYALIIANEEYQFVDNVNYASYDGETFKEYCIKTLGIPERQVRYCSNASYGIISGAVDWLSYALNNFEGSRAIVYYCGHGIPDEKTGEAFIVPVDGKGTNTTTCYSLNTLYKTLAATKATSITYFMDACFTGANKEGSMLVAARGVAREPKKETIAGNAVVFSASSGDETAMTYEEKQHGLFTYYLLKKLQETSGNVTYNELADYISKNVKKDAFLLNEKPQTPVVATSPAVSSSWKNMKL